jgi:uncharacterized protein (TIGR02246 family)
MRADPKTEQEVLAVFDRFNEAVPARDLPATMALFAQEADVLLLASEAGEVAIGRGDVLRFFTRIFSRPVRYSWEWSRRGVSSAGDIAWVFAEGEVVVRGVEGEKRGPYRITGVLVRREGRWLLVQFHGSEPA